MSPSTLGCLNRVQNVSVNGTFKTSFNGRFNTDLESEHLFKLFEAVKAKLKFIVKNYSLSKITHCNIRGIESILPQFIIFDL